MQKSLEELINMMDDPSTALSTKNLIAEMSALALLSHSAGVEDKQVVMRFGSEARALIRLNAIVAALELVVHGAEENNISLGESCYHLCEVLMKLSPATNEKLRLAGEELVRHLNINSAAPGAASGGEMKH